MWRMETKACLSIMLPAAILGVMLVAATATAELVDLTQCEGLTNEGERLKCYDAAAGRTDPATNADSSGKLGEELLDQAAKGAAPMTALSRRWELDPETKQGVWLIRPYNQMFIMPVRYSDNVNESPQSPTQPNSQTEDLKNIEAEFQISFKVKIAENLFSNHADLWFGYTQQSQWQVYNESISRSFRETDYQPELFFVVPMRYNLFGLTGRFVQLSVVHQSNGQTNPLHRSWNRAYANFGFERGNFALYVRPWYRFPETSGNDLNPDIIRFMGYGDITAIYKWGRQEFSLLGRYNISTSNGAAQGAWSFPIQGRLNGFVKVFTGYGETLIDYNFRQTTIGVGILLVQWL
jgi:phospholipase A1